MITVDPKRFLTTPFKHQLVGVKRLVTNPAFALFDEMGVGKSKQVVDAAGVLFDEGVIDTVVVVAPSSVREVWTDPKLGEVTTHGWVPAEVQEFSARNPDPELPNAGTLSWVVTSYEYLRRQEGENHKVFVHLKRLVRALRGRRVALVLDESSYVKSRTASQTKACLALRKTCDRAVLLNGTPVSHSPLDLWAQMCVLDRDILRTFKNFYHFRARYAVMGGFQRQQVVAWKNLDELNDLLAPYVLRRVKTDCLDLPDKLYTTVSAQLDAKTWRAYREMRDEMVTWLEDAPAPVVARQAVVKMLRLAQLTAGFLGGEVDNDGVPTGKVVELGDTKLRAILSWMTERRAADPDFRVLVWCRFRPELTRFATALREDGWNTWELRGGQSATDRRAAIKEFQTGATSGPCALVGQPQAGGIGLNLTSVHHVVYASNDFNLRTRLQSEDRVHRPGQRHPVTYVDVLTTGPNGGRTIDHYVTRALRAKDDLARWTTDRWRIALRND